MTRLRVSDTTLECLSKFCDERQKGRPGKLYWDSFLSHAMAESPPMAAAGLHSFLTEELNDVCQNDKNGDEQIESLIDDYQRIERIFNEARAAAAAKTPIDENENERLPDLMRLASSLWNALSDAALSTTRQPDYIPAPYKNDHEAVTRKLSQPITAGSIPLGRRVDAGTPSAREKDRLAIPPEVRKRNPNMLVLGAPGAGKTRFLANAAAQDIMAGDRAVVVIDQKGDLTRLLRNWVAKQSNKAALNQRMVVIDPTRNANSPGFNPLAVRSSTDPEAVASELVAAFKAMRSEPPGAQSQWNAQTANILRNCALLLMANSRNLADLPTLLSDNDFRDTLLNEIKRGDRSSHVALIDTWAMYCRLARTDQWIVWVEPILNRLCSALSEPRIRAILTNEDDNVDLIDVVKQKKILLVNLGDARFGGQSKLLGCLLAEATCSAAMSSQLEDEPNALTLYVDEMDDIVGLDVLMKTKANNMHCRFDTVYSAKCLHRLPAEVCDALIAATGAIACFTLARKDAELIAPEVFHSDARTFRMSPNASHEEKTEFSRTLGFDNVQRLINQEARKFYCSLTKKPAGIFQIHSDNFADGDD